MMMFKGRNGRKSSNGSNGGLPPAGKSILKHDPNAPRGYASRDSSIKSAMSSNRDRDSSIKSAMSSTKRDHSVKSATSNRDMSTKSAKSNRDQSLKSVNSYGNSKRELRDHSTKSAPSHRDQSLKSTNVRDQSIKSAGNRDSSIKSAGNRDSSIKSSGNRDQSVKSTLSRGSKGSRGSHSHSHSRSSNRRTAARQSADTGSVSSTSSASSDAPSTEIRVSQRLERTTKIEPVPFDKNVRFSNVELREYERIVGDNPSCSAGPPIGIGWCHGETKTTDVATYEVIRPNRKHQDNLVLSREEREQMLLQWGVTLNEIIEAVRSNIKTKNQRRQTVTNLGKVEKLEEAMQSVKRKVKRLFFLKKRTGQQVKQLQERADLAASLATLRLAEQEALEELRTSRTIAESEPSDFDDDEDDDNADELSLTLDVAIPESKDSPDNASTKRRVSEAGEASVLSGFTLGNSTSPSVLEMERFYRELELEMFGDQELPSMVGQTLECPGLEIPEEDKVYTTNLPEVNDDPDDDISLPPPPGAFMEEPPPEMYYYQKYQHAYPGMAVPVMSAQSPMVTEVDPRMGGGGVHQIAYQSPSPGYVLHQQYGYHPSYYAQPESSQSGRRQRRHTEPRPPSQAVQYIPVVGQPPLDPSGNIPPQQLTSPAGHVQYIHIPPPGSGPLPPPPPVHPHYSSGGSAGGPPLHPNGSHPHHHHPVQQQQHHHHHQPRRYSADGGATHSTPRRYSADGPPRGQHMQSPTPPPGPNHFPRSHFDDPRYPAPPAPPPPHGNYQTGPMGPPGDAYQQYGGSGSAGSLNSSQRYSVDSSRGYNQYPPPHHPHQPQQHPQYVTKSYY